MALRKELKSQSFVLLAKRSRLFIPANYSQYWLDVKGIIPASSIDQKSIFTPQFVQALSGIMNLLVTPEQIQVSTITPEEFETIVSPNLVALVQNIDDAEFNGLGLNINWYLLDDDANLEKLSRKYFFNPNNPGNTFFNIEETTCGAYLSKQIDFDIRLKLDIKPVNLFDAKLMTSNKAIQFAFNFHSDLRVENQREKVIDILKKFDNWSNIAKQIIDLYN
jgi:hypothetical protein